MTPRGEKDKKDEMLKTKIQIEMQDLREFLETNRENVDPETIF